MDFDILINKDNILDKDFVPNDLVITDNNENNFHKYKDPNLKPQISNAILPYFTLMQKDAYLNGFSIIVDSGYRSFNYQQVIWDKNVLEKGLDYTQKYVMLPGSSEHQSGLAFDVAYYRNGIYTDDVKEDDPEYNWLINNSYKYCFILRYPKDKENITHINFEPWHFRFVGINAAKIIHDNNITLEEYHLLKEKKLKR